MEEKIQPTPSQDRVSKILHKLSLNPPNVLLLEGGDLKQRFNLGLYWAALLNCPNQGPPCQQCKVCQQISEQVFRDLYIFDGQEDWIKIDQVRPIRTLMGQVPDSGYFRVFIFNQAQELTNAAANALLKSLEEPLPGNVFVLLTSQRSNLLPTLVSRSFVLTLNWQRSIPEKDQEAIYQWEKRWINFWRTGQGLFEFTGKKGQVDKSLVQELIAHLQRSLIQIAVKENNNQVAKFLASYLSSQDIEYLSNVLNKSLEVLNYQVNPSSVLDWTSLQVWRCVFSKKSEKSTMV